MPNLPSFLFLIMLVQNSIGLFQPSQASKNCAEEYILCEDFSLVSKHKGHHGSTNGKNR